jgi:hypothetical protein
MGGKTVNSPGESLTAETASLYLTEVGACDIFHPITWVVMR